jgi:hypothetical protein
VFIKFAFEGWIMEILRVKIDTEWKYLLCNHSSLLSVF